MSGKVKLSIRPTRPVAAVPLLPVHERLTSFFSKYGPGPFDLEAITHFVLRGMDITPYDFVTISASIKKYILDNYRIEQGPFRARTDMHVRHVLVHYK